MSSEGILTYENVRDLFNKHQSAWSEAIFCADTNVKYIQPYLETGTLAYLDMAQGMLGDSKVLFGAQNMHYEDKGAFTGEVSAHMLNDFGCELVIIGHSERRAYYNETDETVNLKVNEDGSLNSISENCDYANDSNQYYDKQQTIIRFESIEEEEFNKKFDQLKKQAVTYMNNSLQNQ